MTKYTTKGIVQDVNMDLSMLLEALEHPEKQDIATGTQSVECI